MYRVSSLYAESLAVEPVGRSDADSVMCGVDVSLGGALGRALPVRMLA